MSRILLHSLVFTPDRNSTAFLLADLVNQLQILGHNIIVLTTTPHNNVDSNDLDLKSMKKCWLGLLYKEVSEGITVLHIKLPKKGSRVFSRMFDYIYFHIMSLIVGLFLLGPYDIVIAPSPPLTIGIIGWLLAANRRVPFIYNIQELYPDFAVNQGLIKNKFFIEILRWIEKFVYARSTILVPVAVGFSEIIQQRGISKDKINVIPNFVDTNQFPALPRKNSFSRKYNLQESFIVYYGGNIGLSQDWDTFLYAAKTLSHLDITFIVSGDGVSREWLENEVRLRNLKNINLLGYQEKQIIPYIYASSDICTIPMKAMTNIDTFPSKIYSIMASGKPVLAQAEKGSDLWMLINEAKCGWVVLPSQPQSYTDILIYSYYHREELTAMGKKGRSFVLENYSKVSITQKYNIMIGELTK